jgi:hypothetical protein
MLVFTGQVPVPGGDAANNIVPALSSFYRALVDTHLIEFVLVYNCAVRTRQVRYFVFAP